MKKLMLVLLVIIVAAALLAAAPAAAKKFGLIASYPPDSVQVGDTLRCTVTAEIVEIGQPGRMVGLSCKEVYRPKLKR